VIHLQPFEHDRFVVVGALHQPSAAARALRRRVRSAGRRGHAAVIADHARRQPPYQLGLRHDHVDDDQRIAPGHERIERRRLGDRPRKAVEDEPRPRVLAVEPLANDPDHHLVADQLTAIHDRLGAQSHRGARMHRLAQDVTG
jgi:hypothetical protein